MGSTPTSESVLLHCAPRDASSGSTSRSGRRTVTIWPKCWRFRSAPFGVCRIPAKPTPHGRSTPTESQSCFPSAAMSSWRHQPTTTAYRLRPIEIQVLVTGDYLLTLHGQRVSLPAVLIPDLPEERSRRYVVYSVLDAVLTSNFDALGEVELRLDAVAARWSDESNVRLPRTTLREAGARLATLRRRVRAEQAVFERAGVEIGALRGFDTDEEPYFDRLVEQVNRLVVSIDAAANSMGMLLDLQLNERAYVVSVLAAIFVPLTFITGFFGMNFGWMVDQIDSPIAFWLLAFVMPIVTGVLAWRLVVRRFLTGEDS